MTSMTHTPSQPDSDVSQPEFKLFDILTFALALYSILSLTAQWLLTIQPRYLSILHNMDNLVCLVFFIDFVRSFRAAKNKLQFMKTGWIDLLACVPAVEELRALRVIQVVRIIRLFRAVKSMKNIWQSAFKDRTDTAFATAALISFFLMTLGPILILHFESGVDGSNIATPGDAIWWAFVTITTVGYGDYYPVTTGGRIVAATLCVAGIGLFGTFSGMAANWLLGGEAE